jgi:hydrogenase maturation factor
VKRDLLSPLPAGKLPPWLLKKILPASSSDPQVLVGPGIGRDAAAIGIGNRVVVAKSDPITFVSEGGEAHLVDVNANDIACMGATPRWLLVTSLLPEGITPAEILRDVMSLREACRHRSVELVGGHTEIVPGLVRPILVGMMLGEAEPGELIEPGQAQPGDRLLLTKGLAIEGTALLAREREDELRGMIGEDAVNAAARLLRDPGISVVKDAAIARSAGGVVALHDPTEGGIATAIRELASASRTGATVDLESIPILPETRLVAEALGLDPLGLLASGSLLIAVQPNAEAGVILALEREGIPVSGIGRLTEELDHFTLETRNGMAPLPEFAVDEVARLLASEAENEN